MTTQTTSPPYESVDPRAWYPAVREAVPLEQACREYLVANEFPDDLDSGDPRLPQGERRLLECYANLAVAAAAELATTITPVAMGRVVANEVLRHDIPPHEATGTEPDSALMRRYYDGEREWLHPALLSHACAAYLAAKQRVDGLDRGDAGFQEAESAELAAVMQVCFSATTELTQEITPYEMGRIAVRGQNGEEIGQ